MKGIVGVALFFGGAAVGFLAANAIMKKHYEEVAEEEIKSVKEYYKGVDKEDNQQSEDEETEQEDIKEEPTVVEEFINNYVQDEEEPEEVVPFAKSEYEMDEETEASIIKDKPYLIEPDEFGEGAFDYQLETLYYYTDGVLANAADEIIDNESYYIGDVDLTRFDVYDDDDDNLIYVRNDNTEHDYEISKERCSYAESMAGIGWDS